jgi:hypothetical protein
MIADARMWCYVVDLSEAPKTSDYCNVVAPDEIYLSDTSFMSSKYFVSNIGTIVNWD